MQPDAPVRRRHRLAIPILAFVVLLVLMGVWVLLSLRHSLDPAHHDTDSHTYQSVSDLAVSVDSGNVTVRPGTGDAVTVRRTLSWNDDKPALRGSRHGDKLDVTSTSCRGGVSFGFANCRVDVTITMPAAVPLTLRTDSGDTTISGLSGPAHVVTSSGDVTARDLTGALDVSVDSGNLSGTGIRSKKVRVDADSGDVDLDFTAVPDRVSGAADSGNVTIRVPRTDAGYAITSTVDSGDRTLPKSTTGSPHQLDLTADSGDVTVSYRG